MRIAGKDRCIKCMHPLEDSGVCSYCGFDESSYEPSVSALKPGTCLHDRYFIGCVIGQGGFGITYSAWDIMLTIKIAIKEYYPQGMVGRGGADNRNTHVIVQNKENASRFDKGLREFLREARTLAQFDHFRGVVSIRDFFAENNTAYIAMEYVDGIPISSYIRSNGPLSGKQLLEKMEPILYSMNLIHELGYLHRDISANNVMFMTDGQLKLIDFGAARMIENEDITITASIKRGYSPSEQYLTKGKLGEWTDIYSLCATMYFMLTGKVPDDAIERIIEDKVKPLAADNSIDLDMNIRQAIDKGMSVRAEDRYQKISDLYMDMYPDAVLNRERVILPTMATSNKGSGRKKKAYSKTMLKNELDRIKAEQIQKQHKRRRVIIGIVILLIVLSIGGIGYTGSRNYKSDARLAATKTATPQPTSSPTEVPVATEGPTESPTDIPVAMTQPTDSPAITEKPTKKPRTKPKTTAKPKPTARPKATKKPEKKKPDNSSKDDNSVGTLDGI